MKSFRLAAISVLFSGLSLAAVPEEKLQADYFSAYKLWERGELNEKEGRSLQATSNYREAARLLSDLQDSAPEWHSAMVRFRAGLVKEALARSEAASAEFRLKMERHYLTAYLAFQKGREHEQGGRLQEALAAYQVATEAWTRIRKEEPAWQNAMVSYRVKLAGEAIERVQRKRTQVRQQKHDF